MASSKSSLTVVLIGILFVLLVFTSTSNAFHPKQLNRIEGRMYDQSRSPLADVYVELLNDVQSMVARTKSTSDGRFTFFGMASGTYQIRALPLGTNFIGQTQSVEVGTTTRGNSDVAFVEFYLREKKRPEDSWQDVSPGTIFVQEIPTTAKELYNSGLKLIGTNEAEGLVKIESSLNEFPNYYDALIRLGQYYVGKGEFAKASPYITRAVDVNPRSFVGYYLAGYSYYRLNQIPAAIAAAKTAVTLNAGDCLANLVYGTVLRIDGDYKNSEVYLLKARSLDKKDRAEIHWQLSLLYNRLSRNKDAADELEIYLKLNPDSPDKQKIKDTIALLRAKAASK
ncbi:MAG: tetratricopeptide repeat protein [Acidobacteriota bacterium]